LAREILDFLQFYAKWHFGQEEDCFDRFYTEWQTGNMTSKLAERTYNELEQWLVNHMARTDTQLRPCVKT